ncbi:MAG: butyrate kinase [Mogibacterium sp.]|nr:butyrate kinase [Mogibacterium sp.]
MERILVMNLGSTSSKIAVYEDDKELFSQTLRHSKEEMSAFDDVLEQFDFRKEKIYEAMKEHGIALDSLTCACSRGGNILACPHGAIGIDQAMIDYLTRPDDTSRHASLLGSMVAFDLAGEFGIPALIYDAIGTDEKQPVARVSGVPELPHFTVGHTLNTRAMAIKCAEEKLGKKFEECNFIVAHLGGGSSIRLYKNGVNIDSVNDDDGNFTPERGGGVGAKALVDMCFSGKYSHKEMARKFHGNGGFKAHLNTTDAMEVEKMIEDGDEYAKMIYDAMSYSIAKDIGKLAVVVSGDVDRIILTGGIARSDYVCDYIKKMVEFIAPVEVMAGEFEMEALAAGALRVLRGEEELQDFGKIAEESVDRLRIVPGVEPGTAPAKYFE